MTTQAEIEKQIDNDYGRFYLKTYDGYVPKGLISWFRKAVMSTPPTQLFQQKYTAKKIKELMEMSVNDIKNVEVGLLINLILLTPPKEIFEDELEAINMVIELDEIRIDFNKAVEEKRKQLQAKYEHLMKQSGVLRVAKYNPTPNMEPEESKIITMDTK